MSGGDQNEKEVQRAGVAPEVEAQIGIDKDKQSADPPEGVSVLEDEASDDAGEADGDPKSGDLDEDHRRGVDGGAEKPENLAEQSAAEESAGVVDHPFGDEIGEVKPASLQLQADEEEDRGDQKREASDYRGQFVGRVGGFEQLRLPYAGRF